MYQQFCDFCQKAGEVSQNPYFKQKGWETATVRLDSLPISKSYLLCPACVAAFGIDTNAKYDDTNVDKLLEAIRGLIEEAVENAPNK